MAKIPRAELAGPAQQTRGVVNVPVVEASTAGARALAQAGGALQEFGDRLYKADVDKKVTEADRKTREDLDREYRTLEESGDVPPDQFEARYKDASDKVIARYGETVPQGARGLWTERAKSQWQSDGILKTRTLTRTRQLEGVRAGIIEESAALKAKVGDLAIEEGTFKQNIQSQRNLIGRQVENGVLQKDDAARLTAELDQWVVDDKTARTSQNVDALVRDGRVAEADALFKANYKELDPAKRAVIEKGLEDAKFDNRVVTTADEIKAKVGNDYGAFVKETAKIKDAALRTKVEERGDRMRLMDDRAEQERQDGLQDQMWAHVEGGGTIMNAPPGLRAAIDPEKLASIRAFEYARDTHATMSDSQKSKWADWSLDAKQKLDTMPPEIFLKPLEQWPSQAKELYDNMDPDRQRAVRQKQIDMREKGSSQDSAMATYRDLVARAKHIVPKDWKLSTETVLGEKDGLEFSGQLYALAKRYSTESGGKAITEKDAREMVARALNAFKPPKSGLFGSEGYPLPPDLMARDMLDRTLVGKVAMTLEQRLGRTPTQAEIEAAIAQVEAAP